MKTLLQKLKDTEVQNNIFFVILSILVLLEMFVFKFTF